MPIKNVKKPSRKISKLKKTKEYGKKKSFQIGTSSKIQNVLENCGSKVYIKK